MNIKYYLEVNEYGHIYNVIRRYDGCFAPNRVDFLVSNGKRLPSVWKTIWPGTKINGRLKEINEKQFKFYKVLGGWPSGQCY